jgi:hypothetical protein
MEACKSSYKVPGSKQFSQETAIAKSKFVSLPTTNHSVPIKPSQPAASCAEATRSGPSGRCFYLLEIEGNQQADYDCEQTQTFDQSGYNQHSSLDFAGSFWLTANGLHSATADTTNAQANTKSHQASTNTSAHYG